jgi:hypothetical protein
MPETKYPRTRELVKGQLRALDDEQLRQALAREGIDIDAAEDFWSTLGDIGKAVLPVAGTVIGTALGGPAGGALGGALGGAVGGLIPGTPAAAPPPPAPPSPAPLPPPVYQPPAPPPPVYQPPYQPPQLFQPQPYPYPYPPAPPPGPRTDPQQSATQLMQMLMRQETLQAILAMMMGRAGRSTVPVGGRPVPVNAFTDALSGLASQATQSFQRTQGQPAGFPSFGAPGGAYGNGFRPDTGFGPPVFGGDWGGSGGLFEMLQESEPPEERGPSVSRSGETDTSRKVETLIEAGF